MEKYTRKQVRLLIATFLAYSAAYISRTNISPALESIQSYFGISAAAVGLLPTMFAIPYAIGQVVNGALADHFRPRNFILTGLLGSSLVNIVFSCCTSFPLLLALWCLNGCFQSMIWTPIVRLYARAYQDAIRSRAQFFLSTSLIVGYLIAWLLSGLLTSHLGWQWAFRVCGMITAVLGLGTFPFMNEDDYTLEPSQLSAAQPDSFRMTQRMSIPKLIFGTDLIFILLCCIFNGYTRDSIMNWTPTMLMETQGIDLSGALGAMLIIPIVNFIGIQYGKAVYNHSGAKIHWALLSQLATCTVSALLLTLVYHVHPLVCTVLLAASSATAYSVNPLLTSILPMDYRETGRLALAAGLIDALIYVGSALSGTFAGLIKDNFGWRAVFASWVVGGVLSIGMVILAMRKRRSMAK